MDNEKLLKALGRLSVETGSLACLGCGWEHDCSTHGCAILRVVRFALEDAEARADEAEASLAAAVRDMEAMAATIRARPIYDTECCFLCKYDGPVEDYADRAYERQRYISQCCAVWAGNSAAASGEVLF